MRTLKVSVEIIDPEKLKGIGIDMPGDAIKVQIEADTDNRIPSDITIKEDLIIKGIAGVVNQLMKTFGAMPGEDQ